MYIQVSIGETKFHWKKGDKSMRFLARLINKKGAKYEEVKLKKMGTMCLSVCVFKVCSMEEILSVESKLEDI